MQNAVKITMAGRGPVSGHFYAMSPEAITELLALESSQGNCTWEVKTGSDPDVALYAFSFFFFFKHL